LITGPKTVGQTSFPDENAAGLVDGVPGPSCYDGHMLDTDEVSGIVARFIPSGAKR
jgi:hypothetical protein